MWLAGGVPTLDMFPLGSVLLPYMPLRLRVFEQRYLIMLSELLKSGSAEFGVVLIERGQEVGGGEHRFAHGTVAEITSMGTGDGLLELIAEGRERFEVQQWLPEEPNPRAEVRLLPAIGWDPELADLLADAEEHVRRTLALASEFREHVWPADVELSDDPLRACWQLAGIAPLGPLDQLELLRSPSIADLLTAVIRLVDDEAMALRAPWPGEGSPEPEA
jgi:uncharacterized protein